MAALLVVVAVALAAALWLAQRLGRVRAERDFAEDTHAKATKTRARADVIDETVARLGDDDVASRLRAFRRGRMPLGTDDHPGAG